MANNSTALFQLFLEKTQEIPLTKQKLAKQIYLIITLAGLVQ